MESADLRGFLRQVTFSYVNTINWNAFGNPECVERSCASGNCPGSGERTPEQCETGNGSPDLEMARKRSECLSNNQIEAIPFTVQAPHRFGRHRQTQASEHCTRLWASQTDRCFRREIVWNEFHIIHDDETIQMDHQLLVLIRGNFEFEHIAVTPDSQISLNAALGI